MSFLLYRSGSVGALAGNRQGHRVPSMFDSLGVQVPRTT